MKYRLLILIAFMATFASMSHAQGNILNCTTGPYTRTGGSPVDNGCQAATTDTRIYSEWCRTTATTSDGTPAGVTYWGPYTSSVTGYGYHTCFSQNYICWPYMNMYEVDGGNANPDGSISDSLYNRFYNQEFDTTYVAYSSNHCPQTGKWYQDFQQCPTKQCAPPPPPPPRCCRCPGPYPAKLENHRKVFLRNVQLCQQGYSTDCCGSTPILIDTTGEGFPLTSAASGVKFDISGQNNPVQIGWTAPGSGLGFLCLPDANGACDDGRDLFGNHTPQPASDTPNGFAALGVYDANHDGVIDARDAIFSRLRLWIDANHDGVSQPNEIFTLPQLGITSISLDYKSDAKQDQYGNVFRYRTKISSTSGANHWAYDVFFVTDQTTTTTTATTCPPRPLLPTAETLR